MTMRSRMGHALLCATMTFFLASALHAQENASSNVRQRTAAQAEREPPKEVAGIPVNYDEDKARTYILPDPLKFSDGKPVRTAKDWEKRRTQLIRLFEQNQYGRAPSRPKHISFDVFDQGTPAFDGKAIRRQVTIHFSQDKNGPKMDLLMYVPAAAKKPVPLLLNISFFANAAVVADRA